MDLTLIKNKLAQLGVPQEVFKHYEEPHRFYHTLNHLEDIFQQLTDRGLIDNEALLLAAVYHDIIYDPKSATNEEDSERYFTENFKGDEALKRGVSTMILDTKTHQSSTALSAIFCEIDLNILHQPLHKLIAYEHQIKNFSL